jgi:hypothetical protein
MKMDCFKQSIDNVLTSSLLVQVHKPTFLLINMRLFMNALSEKLYYIEQLTHDIVSQTNDPLFTVIEQGNGLIEVVPTHLANSISRTVRDYLHPLLEQFPIHEFNPYIHVFISNVINCNLMESLHDLEALRKPNNLYQVGLDCEMMDWMNRMRAFVFQVRQDVHSETFKSVIYNANRASKKNHEGLMRYIDSLFEHYYQLVGVRIDLGYRKGNIIKCHDDILQKYWEAKQDFQRLLNNAKKNRLFQYLVGYVWTLEYGPDKGFHYHLILFFDGSQVRQDVTLGIMVGDYWVNTITGNRGVYWNCNDNKDDYFECGIGSVHYSDSIKRNYLKNAAAYLIKVDHYARMLTPDKGRTFGRGEILPPRAHKVGRPRSGT